MLNEKNWVEKDAIPLQVATEDILEAIDKRINELVAVTKYNCRYVILNGATLINSDSNMGFYYSTKRFDIINLYTGERFNFLDQSVP